jgi:hypothetical protein
MKAGARKTFMMRLLAVSQANSTFVVFHQYIRQERYFTRSSSICHFFFAPLIRTIVFCVVKYSDEFARCRIGSGTNDEAID